MPYLVIKNIFKNICSLPIVIGLAQPLISYIPYALFDIKGNFYIFVFFVLLKIHLPTLNHYTAHTYHHPLTHNHHHSSPILTHNHHHSPPILTHNHRHSPPILTHKHHYNILYNRWWWENIFFWENSHQ